MLKEQFRSLKCNISLRSEDVHSWLRICLHPIISARQRNWKRKGLKITSRFNVFTLGHLGTECCFEISHKGCMECDSYRVTLVNFSKDVLKHHQTIITFHWYMIHSSFRKNYMLEVSVVRRNLEHLFRHWFLSAKSFKKRQTLVSRNVLGTFWRCILIKQLLNCQKTVIWSREYCTTGRTGFCIPEVQLISLL